MRNRYVLDASVLASIVNSDDADHLCSYQFFRTLHEEDAATWVVPGLIFFEFQATQSRRYRERRPGKSVYRDAPLFETNTELFEITSKFLVSVWEAQLYDRFANLKGADLLYACIAKVEGLPLVTHDRQFNQYGSVIEIIRPRDKHVL